MCCHSSSVYLYVCAPLDYGVKKQREGGRWREGCNKHFIRPAVRTVVNLKLLLQRQRAEEEASNMSITLPKSKNVSNKRTLLVNKKCSLPKTERTVWSGFLLRNNPLDKSWLNQHCFHITSTKNNDIEPMWKTDRTISLFNSGPCGHQGFEFM
jgi:hypothetical protein